MAVPVCATLCVRVCVCGATAISESFSLAARLLLVVVVFAVVIGSIHHQQRLQPATSRGQYELATHWLAERRLAQKKPRKAKAKSRKRRQKLSCPEMG